jgi:peptidoglycan-N-acetylglucosamine deacetylase
VPVRMLNVTVCLIFVSLALTACTRERPLPEATATAAVSLSQAPAGQSSAAPEAALTPPVVEPQVSSTTPEASLPLPTPTPAVTPTPDLQTFQYTVQPGDTLTSIAQKFGTTVDVIQQLNTLPTDALFVGQPIYVPYVEGITAAGMPTPTPGPFLYTIQSGDTLSGIAIRFGVSQIDIIENNSLLTPNNLVVGQTVLIPGYQPPSTATTQEGTDGTAPTTSAPTTGSTDRVIHVVRQGEALIDIALRYGITVDQIVAANNITDRNILRIGQELVIPGITQQDALRARSTTHRVQAGESLLGIAVRYGVTIDEIVTANELVNPDSLFIGQELIIPNQ